MANEHVVARHMHVGLAGRQKLAAALHVDLCGYSLEYHAAEATVVR
jgi:hypothetical protein